MNILETPLAGDIDATEEKLKYDTQVKKVLSNKIILAWILKYTVKEFFDYSITEIEKCIEGTPEVAEVPVDAYKNARDSIVEYHMQPDILYGNPTKIFRYDLLSAVMINLGGDELVSENRLINMLTTLLSDNLDKEKKKKKLEEDFALPMTMELEQEVEEMCNLSDYVEEKGIRKGMIEGEKKGELNIIILYNWLKESGRDTDAEAIMKAENETLREGLYAEYNKSKKNA